MRFLTALMKNFKLLFRSKESAYTIVFGPILIILLVSFAFMGSTDEYTVKVGTYAPVQTDLAIKTIATLNQNDYIVSTYPDNESCVESVKTGETHACMTFSEKETGEETVPVTFYLDLSRVNIVYQIIDDLSTELDFQADSIRKQLAGGALARMETATELLGENLESTPEIISTLRTLEDRLRLVQDDLKMLPQETKSNLTNVRELKGYQQGLAQNTRNVAEISIERMDEAMKLIRDLEDKCENCSEALNERIDIYFDNARDSEDEILAISDELVDDILFEANLLIEYAMEDLEEAEGAVKDASAAGASISRKLTSTHEEITDMNTELQKVFGRIGYANEFLKGETVQADTIAAPISTTLVSITVSDDRLSFAYPYLLVLVIMFIGILLASTLVVTNKISRAAFRNFTTPTSDGYHVIVGFVTAFIILLVEIFVILLLSGPFVAQPLLLNFGATMLLICAAIVLFTFIGMIIGYLSTTHEAAMISSISVASILLFVSNLVLPMEGMTRVVQTLAPFNPYIVLSELLKRSMLYGVTAKQISHDLLFLAGFAIVLLILTVLVQRHFKKKYFRQEDTILAVKSKVPRPLVISGTYVHDPLELMDVLDKMTRVEFDHIIHDQNVISGWVEKELRNKRLARQLRTKSKERMIIALDKYLKHHAKTLKR